MNIQLYQRYLKQYVTEAVRQSDGTVRSVAEQLSMIQVRGMFVSHRFEKQRALDDARHAFSEHRHWPLEIILRHLGVTLD